MYSNKLEISFEEVFQPLVFYSHCDRDFMVIDGPDVKIQKIMDGNDAGTILKDQINQHFPSSHHIIL